MISFWRIFWLEFVALARSKALATLLVLGGGWMLLFPFLIRGDGTPEGLRELAIRYSLGGVFALLVIALLATATGALARERAARRLQLTLVRPVRFPVLILGKVGAHVSVGAIVLAAACALLALRLGVGGRCAHVVEPVLPSVAQEAERLYQEALANPDTPAELKKADKALVLRHLSRRVMDNYQTIPTNATATWKFEGLGALESLEGLAARLRFTNPMELRQDVVGEFRFGNLVGVISNMTQAVLEVPLVERTGDGRRKTGELTFENRGKTALMIRPRKDLALLAPADAFGWNLLRGYAVMVAVLTLLVSVGMFLSAAFGRPVALFVAFSVLLVGEMSPEVIDRYPDDMETNRIDRMGLAMTRFVVTATRPVSSLSPLETLAAGTCVEPADVCRALALDAAAIPLLLSFLAAFVLPRKQES